MNDIEFVEDEFGVIGVRLNKTLGAFLVKGIPLIADCEPTKKTAPKKNLPTPEQVETLKLMIPKKSVKEQFDTILAHEALVASNAPPPELDFSGEPVVASKKPTNLKELAKKYMAIPATKGVETGRFQMDKPNVSNTPKEQEEIDFFE